ncbi:MAG: AraC family transcriptional regulator [Marinobacter sp.]|uniref:helix-turn-helix domain-containing protein n=1 Tax=Marinobacter sp. TaxID=50741 RepID=UPI00299F4F67|nr:AraC family transcriptional regulator [Marinobacter sp.]MDX1633492.1 AraC family transcriptional regulator [Marinobacter sp.]
MTEQSSPSPGPRGHIYLWPQAFVACGDFLPNRPHRHISASVLISYGAAFGLEVNGQWRQTRAALVAPDVPQALAPGDSELWIAQLDPDSPAWLGLRARLAERPSVDLELPPALLPPGQGAGCTAMGSYLASLVAQAGVAPERLDPRVLAVADRLRRTLPEQLVVADLAAQVTLSPSRLSHLFRQQTGVSLQRFLLHLKIARALAHWQPGKTLSQLAVEAGFYDQPHLVRTARAMFDALPSQYVSTGWFQVSRCGGQACGEPARAC